MTRKRRGIIRMDAELRAFIDGIIDQHPYEEVHDACVEKFGHHRAPSTATLSRYWISTNMRGKTRALWMFSRVVRDVELRNFIEENKSGSTFERLTDLCRERFGGDRTPSVATIARYWMRVHGRQRRAALRPRKPRTS